MIAKTSYRQRAAAIDRQEARLPAGLKRRTVQVRDGERETVSRPHADYLAARERRGSVQASFEAEQAERDKLAAVRVRFMAEHEDRIRSMPAILGYGRRTKPTTAEVAAYRDGEYDPTSYVRGVYRPAQW